MDEKTVMASSAESAAEEAPESPELAAVRERLDQIVQEVSDEDISLDAALDLYEEAVKLGTKATELLEGQAS